MINEKSGILWLFPCQAVPALAARIDRDQIKESSLSHDRQAYKDKKGSL